MPITATSPPKRRSIVVVVGLLMVAVVGLGVASMLGSVVIAEINRGMATAVNQSGTLRMQSYRIATALNDASRPLAERRRQAAELAREYEQRITSRRLTDALPRLANDPVRLAYDRVRWRWVHEMRRAVAVFTDAEDEAQGSAGRAAYLARVDDFVADIHGLVRVLEERAERRIELLRWMQLAALALTIAAVLVTLVIVQRRVVVPLGELLRCAERVRRGDFSAPARVAGTDELGRLGAAMNLMTDGLSGIYGELEARVAERTRDLERTNHSLDLLYRTSRSLDQEPITEARLRRVLADLRDALGVAEVVLYLTDGEGVDGASRIGTSPPLDARLAAGDGIAPADLKPGPANPVDIAPSASFASDADGSLVLAVRDAGRRFGLLRVRSVPERPIEPWQRPLLVSLAAHLATALALRARMRESRRLVLHEERSSLARELHDSLAQSLSYLKIQAARLDAALRVTDVAGAESRAPGVDHAHRPSAAPGAILTEMRTGIGSAYRHLRELLTTFRLRMDGDGLGSALADTVREHAQRGSARIRLRDRLPPGLLSANEEVHVLQIVREALVNVLRHACAGRAWVLLGRSGETIHVIIGDDGLGCPPSLSDPPGLALHHGTTIMRERAQSLGGTLHIRPRPGGGTRVLLRFRPRNGAPATHDEAADVTAGARI